MSHTRHAWAAVVGSVAALSLLSGCFGSGGSEPTAAHRTSHHRTSESAVPSDTPATTSPATAPTASMSTSELRFSPKSGGKHLDDCQKLVPGDDPAEFLYYPVVVKATSAVTLDSVLVEFTGGVATAGSWVARAGPTPETGTFKGWPPAKIVTGDSNLRWSERVPAKGAALAAGTSYNVFLRLQVDPTPGDSQTNGLEFRYHDASGPHTDTWVAHTTFSMDC